MAVRVEANLLGQLTADLTRLATETHEISQLLGEVKDEAVRRRHPDRHAKLETFRKAALAADRALAGVIRYIEQEASEMPRARVLVEAKR